jgi:predicted nucleic acid-binding protein
MIVVDASLGVKWFLDEAGSDTALDILLDYRKRIVAPALFGIEVSAALVREINSGNDERTRGGWELARLFALFESGAVTLRETDIDTLSSAVSIAIDLSHPLKDCIYLALAMTLDCELFTADMRFAAKAETVWSKVRGIGN